jgi:hypothetical protein
MKTPVNDGKKKESSQWARPQQAPQQAPGLQSGCKETASDDCWGHDPMSGEALGGRSLEGNKRSMPMEGHRIRPAIVIM